MFLLVVLAVALVASWREVAAAAALATALAAASGAWNHNAGSSSHLTRIVVVGLGALLAVATARARDAAAVAREEADDERHRLELLAEVARPRGAVRLEAAVAPLAEILLPALGDCCWLDLFGPDRSRRLLARALGPDSAAIEAALAGPPEETEPPEPALLDPQSDERLARAGLASAAVVPLHGPGGLRGALGVATVTPGRRLDADDLRLLRLIAGRVALVLANARLVSDLRSTRARLDGILGALAEAVTVHDDHGQTVYANDAAARLLGRDLARGRARAPARRARRPASRSPTRTARRSTLDRASPAAGWCGRARAGRCSPAASTSATGQALLAAHQGHAAATTRADVRGQHHRGRHRGQGGRAAPALPRPGRPGARLLARLRADAAGASPRSPCRGSPTGARSTCRTSTAASSRSRSRTSTRRRSRWPSELRRALPARTRRRHRRRRPSLRGGPAELFREIPDELLEQAIDDPEQLEAIRERRHALGDDRPDARSASEHAGRDHASSPPTAAARSTRTTSRSPRTSRCAPRTAVQNARLYAEQARVAHTLQASLLPDAAARSSRAGQLAASYQAGERGADVGGDFYDIVPPATAGHLVFLGDVTGKGDRGGGADRASSATRCAPRARFDPRPGAVLALVNEILVEQPRLAPVTLVCAADRRRRA